jgi:hypothetical protein
VILAPATPASVGFSTTPATDVLIGESQNKTEATNHPKARRNPIFSSDYRIGLQLKTPLASGLAARSLAITPPLNASM